MKKTLTTTLMILAAVLLVFTGCTPKEVIGEEPAATTMTAAAPAVSDGSEDLTIDFQVNLAEDDDANHFTFAGNIRYLAADNDHYDAVTGASALRSTEVFQAYLYDVEGKNTMSSGLRGLFLFGVNPYAQVEGDSLNAYKSSDGTITIQYAHRGSAYRIITDSSGKLALPGGSFDRRAIGYISGHDPQVISTDFSSDGTSAGIDWKKVWDSGTPDGKEIGDSGKKTGPIARYAESPDAMYIFDGVLDVTLENDILKISGVLTAVKQ